jgi:hypothetical protein
MKRRSTRNVVDPEKRRRRRVIIFSMIMIGLMVFSVAEVIIYNQSGSGENRLVYGEYEFVYRDLGGGAGVLVTEIAGQEVEFQNLPTQVGYLPVDSRAIALLKESQQVGLSVDLGLPLESAGLVDYVRLQLGLAIPKMFNAVTQADPATSLPVMNCSRATAEMPIVLFNVLDETFDDLDNTTTTKASIVTQDACIIVTGVPRDIARLKDRVIFEYYDIMRDGVVVD